VISYGLFEHTNRLRVGRETMPIKATLRSMLLIMLALALAAPAFAQVRPRTLSDATEPGSVIVFPKFKNALPVPLPSGIMAPASALKIGVVCPKGVTCSSDQAVTIRFHWVCPPSAPSTTCQEADFDVTATVFEKIILVPDGTPENGYQTGLPTKSVPVAPCAGGYLIGWVTDNTGQPIKFDGLIGSADLRDLINTNQFSPLPLASYQAIPIQANPGLATGAAIKLSSSGGLVFDGGANHYQAVTGRVFGNVRYRQQISLSEPAGFTSGTQAFLTLLTLDVMSNRPNRSVFVDLDFFGGNPSTIGNENQLSASTNFICWEEVAVDAINPGLTTTRMGLEGVFTSATAEDATGAAVTLLGLVKTFETLTSSPPTAFTFVEGETFDALSNDSVPVPTTFVPH
jgi:hypothetical protein